MGFRVEGLRTRLHGAILPLQEVPFSTFELHRRPVEDGRCALPGVPGLGFGVWGLGFGVWGLGFGDLGLGIGLWGLGFRVWGLGFRVQA